MAKIYTEPHADHENPRHYNYILCCGERLYIPDFTNTCPHCGTDYNWAGQRLAPRHQWGEETGEHYTDCI